jgi:hypothetical protein
MVVHGPLERQFLKKITLFSSLTISFLKNKLLSFLMSFVNNYLPFFSNRYLHFITTSLFFPIHQHEYEKTN